MMHLIAIVIAALFALSCGACSTPARADYDRCAGQYKYCPYGTVRVCMCAGSQCQLVCVKP